jgi:hypothetical protein
MMMMNTLEGVEPTGGDSGSVPPPNSSDNSLLSLCFCVFYLRTAVTREHLGDPFIVDFSSRQRGEPRETYCIECSRRKRVPVARPILLGLPFAARWVPGALL